MMRAFTRRAMAPRVGQRAMSVSWSAVPKGPADPCATRAATVHCTPCPLLRLVLSLPPVPLRRILGLVEAFNKDTNPKKASLSVGAYRDGDGKPWVLPSVKEAERRVVESSLNKEYAGITGLAKYAKLAIKFALGADSPALQEGRVASVQTLWHGCLLRHRRVLLSLPRQGRRSPADADVGEPHPDHARRGARRALLPLLRQGHQRPRLRGHDGGPCGDPRRRRGDPETLALTLALALAARVARALCLTLTLALTVSPTPTRPPAPSLSLALTR